MTDMRKAQSMLEFSLLLAAIVAALVMTQIYVKRGIMGKLRAYSDEIGPKYALGSTTANAAKNVKTTNLTSASSTNAGLSTTQTTEIITTSSNENVIAP